MRTDSGKTRLNSYLAGVAERITTPEPPVYPRLPSRFEPGPILNDTSIDQSNFSLRGQLARVNAREDRLSGPELARSPNMFEPRIEPLGAEPAHSPQARPNSTEVSTTALGARRAAHGTRDAAPELHVAEPIVETSPPTTVRPRKTRPATTRQPRKISAGTEPLDKTIDERPRGIDASEPGSRRVMTREAPNESLPVKPQPLPPRDKEAGGRTMLPRIRARKLQPPVDNEKEPQPPARRRPTVGEAIETIVIREKAPVIESVDNHRATPTAPPPQANVPAPLEKRETAPTLPLLIQSRLARLIETGEAPPSNQSPALNEPTINVTIGRIEVRAVQTQQSPAKARAASAVMNLDDYLRRRSQGGAR